MFVLGFCLWFVLMRITCWWVYVLLVCLGLVGCLYRCPLRAETSSIIVLGGGLWVFGFYASDLNIVDLDDFVLAVCVLWYLLLYICLLVFVLLFILCGYC